MNEKNGELYSALLDGELNDSHTLQAVDRLGAGDQAELEALARYQLIGDVLRGEGAFGTTDIFNGVRERIQDEPTVLAPRRRSSNWLRPAAGLAVAASVAASAVFVAPQLLNAPVDGGTSEGVDLAQRLPAAPAPVALVAAGPTGAVASEPPTLRWQTLDSELNERLNRLMIEHQEFAGRSGVNGPVSHIGLVSYDRR